MAQNPMQMIQMLMQSRNPQQMLQNMMNNNPRMKAIFNQAKNSGMSMEQFARQYAKQNKQKLMPHKACGALTFLIIIRNFFFLVFFQF